ncbi:ABC transporter substrate-binding protein [Kribbia dieselivorans]|uniref:ABC transporter substrate-binding protein n=1 Tax=Kribbia dieselivorans TaxID=331526 RepID=UPI000A74E228|nr:ABC transporter substrate-binding protein [Kribbia dieselivorans]
MSAARFRLLTIAALATSAALTLSACGGSAEGQASTETPTELVLADGFELGGYNPVMGYGELGVSPIYEGLLGLKSEGDEHLPEFTPVLAAQEPTVDAKGTTYTVRVRDGVTFHDGSTFGPEDVVATYRAILDPASASEIASSVAMIRSVSARGKDVVFTLKYPYADFPSRLTIGIAPSEKLGTGPAEKSSLNREPIGTGKYRLEDLSAERAVFTAFEDHWDGAAEVTKLTTTYLPDDNTRAQRTLAGEFDGTNLPPTVAATFEGKDGFIIDSVKSADWRGISFPKNSAFTNDAKARLAMNLAVDRQAMVDTVLAGHGALAWTPMSDVYGDAYVGQARFDFDLPAAQRMLDDAGWKVGSDGIRAKGRDKASFTIAYRPTDSVRRDLATAFAGDMKRLGVEVTLEGLDFDKIEPRIDELGILLGGGDKPYSPDTQLYATLHTRIPGAAVWDNPANLGSDKLDEALETARTTPDGPQRVEALRTVQTEYVKDPSHVIFLHLHHTYVSKENGWNQGERVVEPHSHGIGWGPWWNLGQWSAQ